MRCLTLADALRNSGWQCRFAFKPPSLEVAPFLKTSGHDLIQLGSNDPDELGSQVNWQCSALFVDHYELDCSFESPCRRWAPYIMAIEDLADRCHDVDLLLDQTQDRLPKAYAQLVPSDCRVLTGTHYALLRTQFLRLRQASLHRRASAPALRSILVSCGLTDLANLSSFVVNAILGMSVCAECKITVLLGSAAPHLPEIRRLAEMHPSKLVLDVDCSQVASLMLDADLAIGAAGSSAYERCCLGLPSIVFTLADNQSMIARALEASNAAVSLGAEDFTSALPLQQAIENFFLYTGRLYEMSVAASAVCDGLGTNRVVECLQESLPKRLTCT